MGRLLAAARWCALVGDALMRRGPAPLKPCATEALKP